MTSETAEPRRTGRKPDPVSKPGPVWPADAVERRPVAALIPYARNARTHSDEQVAVRSKNRNGRETNELGRSDSSA